jgi:hypothetical protein
MEKIIAKFQGKMTQEQMIQEINNALYGHARLVRTNLANWKSGFSKPDYFMMVYLALKSNGWVRDFALDVLRELRPDLWGGDGFDGC